MAKLFKQAEAKQLGLPGRKALEIVLRSARLTQCDFADRGNSRAHAWRAAPRGAPSQRF